MEKRFQRKRRKCRNNRRGRFHICPPLSPRRGHPSHRSHLSHPINDQRQTIPPFLSFFPWTLVVEYWILDIGYSFFSSLKSSNFPLPTTHYSRRAKLVKTTSLTSALTITAHLAPLAMTFDTEMLLMFPAL